MRPGAKPVLREGNSDPWNYSGDRNAEAAYAHIHGSGEAPLPLRCWSVEIQVGRDLRHLGCRPAKALVSQDSSQPGFGSTGIRFNRNSVQPGLSDFGSRCSNPSSASPGDIEPFSTLATDCVIGISTPRLSAIRNTSSAVWTPSAT